MAGIIITTPPGIELPPNNNPNNPQGLPGVTYTYALLNLPQTWGAKQTFPLGDITLNAADVVGLSSAATGGILPASQMPALTGDITTTIGTVATTLATVNANTGSWGSATQVSQFTVNGKGLLTAAANVTITPAIGSITGLGTGVATALAINTGTAGSYIVNGGALGTPSSGTLTSATGLPISTGVSGLGTGVATALAINTGSSGSFVLGSGSPTVGDLATFNNINGSAIVGAGYNASQVPGLIPTTSTVTITNASPGVVTWTAHGLSANAVVYFSTTGALPTGLTAAVIPTGTISPNTYSANPTLYYVVGSSITANTFQVATSVANAKAGTSVNTSSAGSGTHTVFANAMAGAGCIGELIYQYKDTVTGVALNATGTVTSWNTITIPTAGIWEVWAQSGVIGTPLGGSSTLSMQHMHSNIGIGIATISTAPYDAAAAQHVQTSNANGWILSNPPKQIITTGSSSLNAVMLVDYSAGAGMAYGSIWARRIK